MSKSQKAFIWIFGSSPKMTKKNNSVFSHHSVIPAPHPGEYRGQKAFTLIELLITISILAILGSAISIVLNPAELLAEARDSQRINDLESLRNSLSLTLIDNPSLFGSLSNTSIYLSLPSSSCLTNPPSGYTYICNAASLNLQKTDSSGWLPLSLTNLPVFPIDPVNSSSSSLYYAFVPDLTNKTFVLTSLLESEKYLKLSALKDGGTDPGRIEEGNPTLWTSASGLVGYWPMDEGSGTTAQDLSGNNNTGTLTNGPTWTTSSSCKVGQCLSFDGVDDYVLMPDSASLEPSEATIIVWVKNTLATNTTYDQMILGKGSGARPSYGYSLTWGWGDDFYWRGGSGVYNLFSQTTFIRSTGWYNIAATFKPGEQKIYSNSSQKASGTVNVNLAYDSNGLYIGRLLDGTRIQGLIDDVRIYNRALSAAEIQSIYNSQK